MHGDQSDQAKGSRNKRKGSSLKVLTRSVKSDIDVRSGVIDELHGVRRGKIGGKGCPHHRIVSRLNEKGSAPRETRDREAKSSVWQIGLGSQSQRRKRDSDLRTCSAITVVIGICGCQAVLAGCQIADYECIRRSTGGPEQVGSGKNPHRLFTAVISRNRRGNGDRGWEQEDFPVIWLRKRNTGPYEVSGNEYFDRVGFRGCAPIVCSGGIVTVAHVVERITISPQDKLVRWLSDAS